MAATDILVDSSTLEKMIKALEGNSKVVTKYSDKLSRRTASAGLARDLTSGKLTRGIDKLHGSIETLTGTTDQFSHGLKRMIEGFVGFRAATALVDSAEHLSHTYRDMTDVGQNFSGSMIEMAKQAAQAQLSLDDYSKMMMKNSTVSTIMQRNLSATNQGLGGLQKGVRAGLREFGLYGMSIEQISSLTSDYSETLRLQNSQELLNTDTTKRSLLKFTGEIDTFSQFTGKSRKEIIALTQNALRDTAVTSRMMIDGTDVQRKALEKATAFFAAVPGEAGQVFSTFLAQSFGNRSAIWTDAGKTFIDAGMGSMIGVIDGLKNKIESGTADMGDFENTGKQIQKMDKIYRQTLQLQAMAGNGSAKQVLAWLDQFHGLNFDDLGKQIKRQQGLTKFFSLFEDAHQRLSGAFIEGFLTSLSTIEKAFDNLSKSGTMDIIMKDLKEFGGALGGFIGGLITPKNIHDLDNGVRWLSHNFLNLGTFFLKWLDDLLIGTKEQKGIFYDFKAGAMKIFGIIDWIATGIENNKDTIVEGFSALKYVIVGIVGLFKSVDSALSSIFGDKVATGMMAFGAFMLWTGRFPFAKTILGLSALYGLFAKFTNPEVAAGMSVLTMTLLNLGTKKLLGKGAAVGASALGGIAMDVGAGLLAFVTSAAGIAAIATVATSVLVAWGLWEFAKWIDNIFPTMKNFDHWLTDNLRGLLGLDPIKRDNKGDPVIDNDGNIVTNPNPSHPWSPSSAPAFNPNSIDGMGMPSIPMPNTTITPQESSPNGSSVPAPLVSPTLGANTVGQQHIAILASIENLQRQHLTVVSSLLKENNNIARQGNFVQQRIESSLA